METEDDHRDRRAEIGGTGEQPKDCARRVSTRTPGRAVLGALALVLVLVLGLVALLELGGERSSTSRGVASGADPSRAAGATRSAGAVPAAVGEGAHDARAAASPGEAPTPASPRAAPDLALSRGPERGAESYLGTGELFVDLVDTGPAPLSTPWVVRLEPSRFARGAEHAVARTLEVPAAQRRATISDLALGGYDLWIEAAGHNSEIVPLVLDRDHPREVRQLRLVPAGALEGFVVDHEKLPLAEVPVLLVEMPDGERRTSHSDPTGRFRFERVRDGQYRLFAGSMESPLVPPALVRMRAPQLTVPAFELPRLTTLLVAAYDPQKQPLAGAIVRGGGNAGGWIDGKTDAEGKLEARFLPPGRYRLSIEDPASGASRRKAIDVVLDAENELLVEF
jgi:hypothetical protein